MAGAAILGRLRRRNQSSRHEKGSQPGRRLCPEGATCDSPGRSPAQTADVPRVRRPRETFAISSCGPNVAAVSRGDSAPRWGSARTTAVGWGGPCTQGCALGFRRLGLRPTRRIDEARGPGARPTPPLTRPPANGDGFTRGRRAPLGLGTTTAVGWGGPCTQGCALGCRRLGLRPTESSWAFGPQGAFSSGRNRGAEFLRP
jgi:hypothetical protein